MRKRDIISSIVWLIFGGLFIIGSLSQGLIYRGTLGPGSLPFITGIVLVGISLFVLVPAIANIEIDSKQTAALTRKDLKLVGAAIAALVFYTAAMEYAGFALTTFIFMLFVTRLMDAREWRTSFLIAILTAVISYLVFVVLLDVQLPEGIISALWQSPE
jgi:putative tricarboxylic transport membrane protein